jgi:hypothetical protein
VLERSFGGSDLLPGYDVVGRGLTAVRANRQAEFDMLMTPAELAELATRLDRW